MSRWSVGFVLDKFSALGPAAAASDDMLQFFCTELLVAFNQPKLLERKKEVGIL